MTRSRAGAAFLTAVVLAACGDAAPDQTAATAVVDTVQGTERLRYPVEPARALAWGLDTVTVIGDAFADEPYQFNDVSAAGLVSGPDGSLLLLDRQGHRVLSYDRAGGHLATYGRDGEGPGELSQPLGLDMGPGDTLWVTDFSNSRITGFPLAGGEPRVIPFPDNSGIPSGRMAAVEGGMVMEFRPLFNFSAGAGGGLRMSRGDGSQPERPDIPLVRYGAAGLEPLDTLWTVPEPPSDMVQLESDNRIMIAMMSREFYPEFLWAAFTDGGVVVSDTAAYRFHLLSADGSEVRRIERDPPPRVVTEADREAARERAREQSRQSGGVRIGGGGPDEATRLRMLEQRLEKMTFADLVPRIVSLRVDNRDRIWVGVSEDVADELARIDIYDRDGRLLGELRGVPMPDVFIGHDRVGILRRDELDVQQVVILTLNEGGSEA